MTTRERSAQLRQLESRQTRSSTAGRGALSPQAIENLMGFRVQRHQPLPEGYRKSAWLITFNTNKAGDNAARLAFEREVRRVFTFQQNNADRGRWLRLLSNNGTDERGDPIRLAKNPKMTVRGEIGPQGGRVHAHMLLRVTHFNQLRLNREEILRQLPTVRHLNFQNVFVDPSDAYYYVHKGGNRRDGTPRRSKVRINTRNIGPDSGIIGT